MTGGDRVEALLRRQVEAWNGEHPVGTFVAAWPSTRDATPLWTRTRTPAWLLGDHTPVVSVDDYAGGIALSHVEPVPAAAAVPDRAAPTEPACEVSQSFKAALALTAAVNHGRDTHLKKLRECGHADCQSAVAWADALTPVPAAPTEGAGERPGEVAALNLLLDSSEAECASLRAERDALRALVGDPDYDAEHWGTLSRAEAIRQANDFHAAMTKWCDLFYQLRDERDALRDTVARIEAEVAKAEADYPEWMSGVPYVYCYALRAALSPSPGDDDTQPEETP